MRADSDTPASETQGSEKSARRLLHVFSTFSVGGPQVRFATMANAFRNPFKHLVLAMDGRTEASDLVNPSVDLTLLGPSGGDGSLPSRLAHYRRRLKEIRPDTLITYNWGAIEWALANSWHGCRHLHIEDGFGPEEAERQLPRRVWLRRIALRNSERIIVPSMNLERIATDIWRLPKQRVQYLPNGLDLKRFQPRPAGWTDDRFGFPNGVPVIGTVTALRPEKNLARLISAFRIVLDDLPAHLVIAGDGGERQKLQDLCQKLKIEQSVTFSGHLGDPENLLPAFDVFAISSDTEQMPYSVLEAMACGLPVSGVDVGDIRAMVAQENSQQVVPKDENALAASIKSLLSNEKLRKSIGLANLQRARTVFDETDMIAAYNMHFMGTQAHPGQEKA